jgi:hypothetical protein
MSAMNHSMVFYSEPITVEFEVEPLLEKKPGVPHTFVWRKQPYTIVSVEKEWHNYQRRSTPEMKPRKGGSWGVGRDYYQVKTDSGEVFVIYYDRQPRKSRKGGWILLKKITKNCMV